MTETTVEQQGSAPVESGPWTDWRAVAAATGPADRAAAEAGVRRAYEQAGLAAPERVVWAPSPLLGTAVVLLLTGQREVLPRDVADRADLVLRAAQVDPGRHPAGACVREAVRSAPWVAARRRLHDELGPEGWATRWSLTSAPLWELTRALTDRVRTGITAALTSPTQGRDAGVVAGAGPVVDGASTEPARERTADATALATGSGAAAAQPAQQAGASTESAGAEQAGGELAARETAVRLALADAVTGQHDAAWLAAFDGADELAGVGAAARAAGWWWPYENVVVIAERPTTLHRDEAGRLDSGEGPALAFADGFALYAWRGMPVPADFLQQLGSLTPARVRAEENAELRRVMLEYYGYDRYLEESGAVPVHRDETGVLWRIELAGDEPVVMVEVVNSTPEPDGSSRTYWLRVPPRTTTAREGVAWTFGLPAEEYEPQRQT
ncbi:DUF6745 domain-containing protein [Streptomyces sp. 796.1]|uniref:DUF6745 domain-containing protein n=1 Tax=Streptomyces sp. 796.1 TaxID=3163029 RepID=UPI0039C950AC